MKPCLDRGSLDRALAVARFGLAMARKCGRPRSVLEGALAMGVAHLCLGDSRRALRSLEEARSAPAEHHPQLDAEILLHRGLAMLGMGKEREAVGDLKQAESAFTRLKLPLRAAEARNQLSLALAAQGKGEAARKLSEQAWRLLSRIPRNERPPIVWAEILVGRARLFSLGTLDAPEEMQDLVREMSEVRELLGEKRAERVRWQVTAALARLHERLGETETARSLLTQAGEELDRWSARLPPRLARHLLAQRGDLPAANGPAAGTSSRAATGSRTPTLAEQEPETMSSGDRANAALFHGLVGGSEPMRRLFTLLEKAAAADLPILLRGETGTGKDLAARAIHRLSSRRGGPFIDESLGAIPAGLLESELFGHAAGAFSGAQGEREGLLLGAHQGTLHLADIAELPLDLQAKVVGVLEAGRVRRLGASESRQVDFRLVSSTQRDLQQAVDEGRFRQDLFFRVRGIEIVLPPLRERREDIPLLIEHFLTMESARTNARVRLEADAIERLVEHDWPGNVRELENVIRRLAILGSGRIRAADLGLPVAPRSGPRFELRDESVLERYTLPELRDALERAYLEQAMERSSGSLAELASRLGVHRRTIAKMRRRLGVDRGTSHGGGPPSSDPRGA